MRLVTYDAGAGPRGGIADGERVLDLARLHRAWLRARGRRPAEALGPDLLAFVAHGGADLLRTLAALGRRRPPRGAATPLARVRLRAPIPRPPKNVICLGRNYVEHARELGNPVPETPVFFTKPATALAGPHDDVVAHAVTGALDYEAELVAVIGRAGRDIPPERALAHVLGYTVMNDLTARDLQKRHLQWFKGKGLDGFAPMGPWIVTADEVPDPQALRVRARVNGEVRQDAPTAAMMLRVADVIAALSAAMTLEPGDLIATGTPEGVGMGFDPPRWLRPGDVVECEVTGIGTLRNRIVGPARP